MARPGRTRRLARGAGGHAGTAGGVPRWSGWSSRSVTAIEPAEVADSVPARSALPGPHPTSYRGAAEAVIAAMVAGAALVTGWTVALAFAAPGPVQLAPLTAHVTG